MHGCHDYRLVEVGATAHVEAGSGGSAQAVASALSPTVGADGR
jgi:hypothetical protein